MSVGSPGFSCFFFYTPFSLFGWSLSDSAEQEQRFSHWPSGAREGGAARWRGERERERKRDIGRCKEMFTRMLGHRPQWFNNRLCDVLLPSPLLLSFYVLFFTLLFFLLNLCLYFSKTCETKITCLNISKYQKYMMEMSTKGTMRHFYR